MVSNGQAQERDAVDLAGSGRGIVWMGWADVDAMRQAAIIAAAAGNEHTPTSHPVSERSEARKSANAIAPRLCSQGDRKQRNGAAAFHPRQARRKKILCDR